MKIEISNISQQQSEEFFQYKWIGGRPDAIFDINFPDVMDIATISLWMEKIDAFPIYLCLQISDINTRDFELLCNKNHLTFHYIGEFDGSKVAILYILNRASFSAIIPLIDLISSMEDFVLWSFKKNVFSVDPQIRQRGLFDVIPLNICFNAETIVFSLSQSGLMLQIYSNHSSLRSYNHIINSLPDFLVPIRVGE
ncbi:hypothetical protein [Lysinibacillus sp. 38-6]|uniref:hypothetical protein n=1 Tax=Lysinibacillus sp. 38-6 TaxID=3385991 RepID=UPI003908A18A